MKRRTIIVIVIVIVLIAAVIVGLPYLRERFNPSLSQMENMETETAATGEITATIGETGTVRASQTAVMAWKTSGTVEQVNVEVLDDVKQGQVLASLAFNSLSQNVIQAQSDLINAQEQLDDLYRNFNKNKAEAQLAVINAQEALDNLYNNFDKDQAEAQLAVINAQEELDDLLKDRVWLNYPRCDQDTIEDYQDAYQDAVDRVADLEGRYTTSPDNGFIRDQLIAARKTRDTAFANYNYCISPREESEINEADTEIALAQAKLDLAISNYESFETGEPDKTEIALAKAKLDLAILDYEDFSTGEPNKNDVATLKVRIEAAQATLTMAQITAPFSGTITSLDAKQGDQVNAGVSAMRIDDLSQLLVDLEISEIDINTIEVGQEVIFTFDSIPAREYHGVVTDIAVVGAAVQGVVEFSVTTKILDADEAIKPSMTAIAEIVIDRFEDVLLVPNQAVRIIDGERVVYVLSKDGTPETRTIVLGAQSTFYSQVTGGELKPGEEIILNPVEDMSSFGPGGRGPMGNMFDR